MRDEVNVLFGDGTHQWVGLFADRCDMKVSSWALALVLASTPVLMSGYAYADGGCGGSACKSENTPPVDESAAPLPWLAPDEPTADTDDCGGANCLYSDEDSTIADPDQRRAPSPETVRECTSSNC
jgi:hypothetical protein